MMASKSRIVVEYEEKEFGVVLPVQALFLDEVKKMVTEELKTMYHGFDKVKAGDLTFYSDFERTDEITDEKMPAGERFYANLAAPISPISSDASISSSDEPHPKRLKRWNQINQVLLAKKKAGSSRESIPYSSTSWSDVSPIFLPTKMQYIQVVQDIPSDDFEVLVTMLTWIFRCFGHSLFQLQNKNETQRLHLIAPVLWSVVQLLPDIKVDVECVLDGKRVFAHGRFEFILTRQVRGVTKRICIVEVKHDDFEQGLAQNLLGCEVAADVDNIHEVYGIVTNFEKWIFVKDRDEEIACDEFNFVGFDGEGVPVRDQLRKIVGKIHGLLQ